MDTTVGHAAPPPAGEEDALEGLFGTQANQEPKEEDPVKDRCGATFKYVLIDGGDPQSTIIGRRGAYHAAHRRGVPGLRCLGVLQDENGDYVEDPGTGDRVRCDFRCVRIIMMPRVC